MANFESRARTNYFTVTNSAAFTAWVDTLSGVELVTDDETDTGKTHYALLAEDGWPSSREITTADDDWEEEDIDFTAELSQFLPEGEVAILQQVGWEKLRYLTGAATAVRADGQTLQIDLDDIYQQVKKVWGVQTTRCSY